LTNYHQSEISQATNERLPLKEQLTNKEIQEIDTRIINDINNKRKRENTYTGPPNKRHKDNDNNF